MSKIRTEDCLKELAKAFPGMKWKRVSKRTVTERIFESVGDRLVPCAVYDDGKQIKLVMGGSIFIQSPPPRDGSELCQDCLGGGMGEATPCKTCSGIGRVNPRTGKGTVWYFEYAQDMEDQYKEDWKGCDNPLPFYPDFYIVSKKFWDENGYFDDGVNMSNVKMPKGFWESMEGCFAYDGSKEEAIKKLLGAGFVPLPRKKK